MNLFDEIDKQNEHYKHYNPKIFIVRVDGKRIGGDEYLTYQEATALADECREEKHDGVKTEVEIVEVITFNKGENKMTTETQTENKLELDDVYSVANDVYFEVIRYLDVYDKCVVDDEDTGGTKNTDYGRDLYYLIEDTIKDTLNIKDEWDDEEEDDE